MPSTQGGQGVIRAKNDDGQRCVAKEAELAIEIQKRRHSKGLRGVAGAVRRWLKQHGGIPGLGAHGGMPPGSASELAAAMRKYTIRAAPKKANADAIKKEVDETIEVAKRLAASMRGDSEMEG